MYMGKVWYLLSRDHDVIKIEAEFLEQKGNVLHVVQPTMCSTLSVYDIHTPTACSKLPATFALYPFSESLGMPMHK